MLTLREQHQHLLLFYFGAGTAPISQCVDRAYRDFNRTMHGLKACPRAGKAGRRFLSGRLQDIEESNEIYDQSSFDAWHERGCIDLIAAVRGAGYAEMHIGQAQKWLNMALKYAFVFPVEQLPAFAKLFPWCHVPIDNIILKCVEFNGAPKFDTAWSRIDNYEAYMAFQRWVRLEFPAQSPLAVEFDAWANAQVVAPRQTGMDR